MRIIRFTGVVKHSIGHVVLALVMWPGFTELADCWSPGCEEIRSQPLDEYGAVDSSMISDEFNNPKIYDARKASVLWALLRSSFCHCG